MGKVSKDHDLIYVCTIEKFNLPSCFLLAQSSARYKWIRSNRWRNGVVFATAEQHRSACAGSYHSVAHSARNQF